MPIKIYKDGRKVLTHYNTLDISNWDITPDNVHLLTKYITKDIKFINFFDCTFTREAGAGKLSILYALCEKGKHKTENLFKISFHKCTFTHVLLLNSTLFRDKTDMVLKRLVQLSITDCKFYHTSIKLTDKKCWLIGNDFLEDNAVLIIRTTVELSKNTYNTKDFGFHAESADLQLSFTASLHESDLVPLPVFENRTYTPVAIRSHYGKWFIYAGCRKYNLHQARKHWGSKRYPSSLRGGSYCNAVDWLEQNFPQRKKPRKGGQ